MGDANPSSRTLVKRLRNHTHKNATGASRRTEPQAMKNEKLSPERLLTEAEVENLYGIPRKTLQHHRAHRCGLPCVKIGYGKKARVRYPKHLIDEHILKLAANPIVDEKSHDGSP